MNKSLLLLILVFCSISLPVHAQSEEDIPAWEFDEPVHNFTSHNNEPAPSRPRRPKRKPVKRAVRRAATPAPRAVTPAPKPAVPKPVVRSTPKPAAPKPITTTPRTPAPRAAARPAPKLTVDPSIYAAATTQADISVYSSRYYSSPLLDRLSGRKPAPPPACTDIIACMARSMPRSPAEQAETLESIARIEAMMNWKPIQPGDPLKYVRRLDAKLRVGYGVGRRGAPQCAKAVRLVLESSGLLPRNVNNPGAAKDYVPFLEKHGFSNQMPQACSSPGVVRVYGFATRQSGYYTGPAACDRSVRRKMRLPRGFSLGDACGHIEIVGSDRKFHHFASSTRSIQENIQPNGAQRRPLIGCMVKDSLL